VKGGEEDGNIDDMDNFLDYDNKEEGYGKLNE
jgi:hypothetical protein